MGLRKDRLADEIRDIIANLFSGGQMQDPRLTLVAITAVKLTADLQLASVYYRVIDQTPVAEVQKGLERAAGFLRSRLAENLDIRRVPALRFFFDESIENGERIEGLLRQI
jgi:ribosome-binding factor A